MIYYVNAKGIGRKIAVILNNPYIIYRKLLKLLGVGSFKFKLDLDLLSNPKYAYCLYYAAIQAKALGINKISAIEFGVAGGAGLVELEELAEMIKIETGIETDIYGFDMGSGMPEVSDYKDIPYVWQKGFFKMDIPKLESRLKKSKLIIGNVAETVGKFIEEYKPAPIGFISFDMDYYSSTINAFRLFDNKNEYFLPRPFCYFDNTVGDEWAFLSEFHGESLAIKEFNEANTDRKIGRVTGLRFKRIIESEWNENIYMLHLFKHPLYDKYIYPNKNCQLPLD
ncbi:MAG: hypothetical protein QG635_81 [Bacteroidota bacterium]|nr:hypothetical protein [Bacteroidota bacterium]